MIGEVTIRPIIFAVFYSSPPFLCFHVVFIIILGINKNKHLKNAALTPVNVQAKNYPTHNTYILC